MSEEKKPDGTSAGRLAGVAALIAACAGLFHEWNSRHVPAPPALAASPASDPIVVPAIAAPSAMTRTSEPSVMAQPLAAVSLAARLAGTWNGQWNGIGQGFSGISANDTLQISVSGDSVSDMTESGPGYTDRISWTRITGQDTFEFQQKGGGNLLRLRLTANGTLEGYSYPNIKGTGNYSDAADYSVVYRH